MNNFEEPVVEAEELSLAATRTRTRKDGEELRSLPASRVEGKEEDLEKGQLGSDGREHEEPAVQNPNVVTWDGKDDPSNPKNWPRRRKWYATFVSSPNPFFSPASIPNNP